MSGQMGSPSRSRERPRAATFLLIRELGHRTTCCGGAFAETGAATGELGAFSTLGDCLGSSTLIRAAVFAHPTDATGTKGDFEGEITSVEASFDFYPLKTREYTLGHFGHFTPSRGGRLRGRLVSQCA